MIFRTTIFIFFSMFNLLAYAQFEDVQLNMDGNWHSLESSQGLKINYKFQICDQSGRQVAKYILQLENANAESKNVSFYTETHMNGDCTNCDRIGSDEYYTNIHIDPYSTLEGVCGENNKQLEFFSHFIVHVPGMSGRHLTDLKIVNLVIN